MNYTTNYHLPQWEEADRVKREDVNGAMSSIDTALANAGGLTLLKTFTLAEETTTPKFDVSDVDFTQWRTIYVTLDLTGSGSWMPRFSYYNSYGGVWFDATACGCFVLYPMYGEVRPITGAAYTGSGAFLLYTNRMTFADWNDLELSSYSSSVPRFYAGSRVTFYGEK